MSQIFNVIGEAEYAVKNATTHHSRGSWRRRQEVRKYMKIGYKTWAKERYQIWA
jgi:putative alpha-1,2-mannosidase